jgi:hypothetical protein
MNGLARSTRPSIAGTKKLPCIMYRTPVDSCFRCGKQVDGRDALMTAEGLSCERCVVASEIKVAALASKPTPMRSITMWSVPLLALVAACIAGVVFAPSFRGGGGFDFTLFLYLALAACWVFVAGAWLIAAAIQRRAARAAARRLERLEQERG